MGKKITFRSEAREKILRGATEIADAVRVTLGPMSKCVLIDKKWGKPIVCNDRVTIAKGHRRSYQGRENCFRECRLNRGRPLAE
jgi:hypothetical protein